MFKVTFLKQPLGFKHSLGFIKSMGLAVWVVSMSAVAAAPTPTPTLGQAPAAGTTPAPAIAIPDAPALAATGFILVDGETGDVLAQNNADQRLPPASLTKMMSSYLVIDELIRGRINETNMVNISVKAWKMEGSRDRKSVV